VHEKEDSFIRMELRMLRAPHSTRKVSTTLAKFYSVMRECHDCSCA